MLLSNTIICFVLADSLSACVFVIFSFSRLELMTNDPKADIAKFHPNISEDNFAFELISQIVKGFLAATETRVQVFV